MANLLPRGVGSAVARARCPKVYVPNSGVDPEQVGMRLRDCISVLLSTLRRDAGEGVPTPRLLDWVLVDSSNPAQRAWVQESLPDIDALGIGVLDVPVRGPAARSVQHDPQRLAEVLVSLARGGA